MFKIRWFTISGNEINIKLASVEKCSFCGAYIVDDKEGIIFTSQEQKGIIEKAAKEGRIKITLDSVCHICNHDLQ